ncbi:MAG TPA: hypothetical protein VKE70_34195, partial [Candidatus Solibacter sp.]|nr:hypothetical protein [Candidatus Solibacter sp.]
MPVSIRTSFGILAVSAVLALAGCAARAKTPAANPAAVKPTTPATPEPRPNLSTPQTRAQLPKPQPIDPLAWTVATPAPDPNAGKPAAPTPNRSTARIPVPRTETAPPPATTPAEPPRPQIQEIIPANDLKRLQESAQNRKREVARILEPFDRRPRSLSGSLKIKVQEVRNFVKLSDDFEKRGEMRQA